MKKWDIGHEKKAVWAWRLRGGSLVTRAWRARLDGDTDMARRLIKGALAGAPKAIVDTAISDITFAPALERRGLGLKVRVKGEIVSDVSWDWPTEEVD